ncbi:MAG: glycosyltransferase family 2 protein [Desulfonatronovibrio sp.]
MNHIYPLVSVIIPTCNRASYLIKAISSVLEQSFGSFEILLVDDGSDDETKEVVKHIKDERLKYLYQENRGVAAARNVGLKEAKGRFAAFLDSDDYWILRKLELQIKFMQESGFRISQTNEIWIRNGKRVNAMDKHQKPCGWIFEKSLELCLVSPSCTVMEMGLAQEGFIFDEGLMACEDYDLWLKIALKYPVGLLPVNLTVKTGGHADQLSRKITGLDLFRIYSLLGIEQNKDLPFDKRQILEKVLLEKAGIYLKGCLKRGRNQEAKRIRALLGNRLFKENQPIK